MKKFTIDERYENQRIDKYLKKLLNNASSSLIYKMIRKKDVKVNNQRVKENYILKKGDVVSLFLYEDRFRELSSLKAVYDLPMDFKVIYEDKSILIVDKPVGLLVHGDDNGELNTLSNQVLTYLYKKGEYDPIKDRGFTPSPAHRIDRNTSGIVIFGKTMRALQDLSTMLRDHKGMEKTYLTIVKGKMKSQRLIGYVKKNARTHKLEMANKDDGKEIVTKIECINSNDQYSLLQVTILTGRFHQIRFHLASLGHPIVGDGKYGNKQVNQYFKNTFGLEHQFLHSYTITFKDPIGSLKYLGNRSFVSSLPSDLNRIKKRLFNE